MRIGFLCSNIYNSGGTERIAIALANELNANGHQVFFFSLYSRERLFYPLADNIPVEVLLRNEQKLLLNYPRAILKLRKYLKLYKIDVIIDVIVSLSLISIPARSFLGTKVISWEHFNFFISLETKAMVWGRRLSARYADAIVTLTEGDKKAYLSNLGVKTRILSIPNFLPVKVKQPSLLDKNVALAVGRLTYQKGYDTLLQIWEIISRESSLANWNLRIIGNGEDREKLITQAKVAGIEERVEFIPETRDIELQYAAASVFLVTSRWEGLPMVMIEAKSFGLPIVSFDCLTGPRDIVKEDEDGVLVPDQDIEVFAQELAALLKDRVRIKIMGKNALINARFYEPENIVKCWIDLLESLSN